MGRAKNWKGYVKQLDKHYKAWEKRKQAEEEKEKIKPRKRSILEVKKPWKSRKKKGK